MAQVVTQQLIVIDISGDDPSLPFYVYVYRDPRAGKELAPLYVGKGHDTPKKRNSSRARRHWPRGSQNPILHAVLQKIRAAGLLPRLEVVGRFRTEQEAFHRECALIAQYGRRNNGTGLLCNFTDGGEGPSGMVVSAETREKLRITSTLAKADPEVRRKIAEQAKRMHADPEFQARHRRVREEAFSRPDVRAARSASIKASWENQEVRERRMAAQRVALASPEARALKSSASIKSQSRPEVKERHSAGLRARWARWRLERQQQQMDV